MSILLDSLRKSEAQRNVGDAPTIYSTQDYGGSGDSGKRWVGWLLMAVAGLAIVWFGWQQFSFPGQETLQAEGSPVQQETTGDTPASRSAPQQPQQAAIEPEQRTPVEQISQASDSSDAPADEGGQDNSPLDRIVAYEAEMEAIAQSASEVQGEEQDALPMEDEELSELDDSIASAEPLPASRWESDSAQAEPAEDEPMSYWQLPQGLRNELPEFKITVLVYAEEPENRFLLMEGERMLEQDELEGGITLEEIRRDGAVFSFQTWRFLVRN